MIKHSMYIKLASVMLSLMVLNGCALFQGAEEGEEDAVAEAQESGQEEGDEPEEKVSEELPEEYHDYTDGKSAQQRFQEAAEAHDAIDYTERDFHPSDDPEVHMMILQNGDQLDEDEPRNGDLHILYSNGFSEKGKYEADLRQGDWTLYNRENDPVRIDTYKDGERMDFEILKK